MIIFMTFLNLFFGVLLTYCMITRSREWEFTGVIGGIMLSIVFWLNVIFLCLNFYSHG